MATLIRLSEVATVTQGMSMSGRGAGARSGNWRVRAARAGDIQDDRIDLDAVDIIAIDQNIKTEKHLLRPDDVLVAARATRMKAALVPASVSRTVADTSLLVLRPSEQSAGLGPYLWWYLTSAHGRPRVEALMVGATILALPAGSLADLIVPVPKPREMYRIADLVEASDKAYVAAMEAARLRRTVIRDAVIERVLREAEAQGDST
jgi:hypothetical protein